MWTFAFSAAVVFGTVVTRGPRSPLATSAMAELDQACALFTKASVYSIRATKALVRFVFLWLLNSFIDGIIFLADTDKIEREGKAGAVLRST